jgi:hypothetical protein
MLHDLFGLPAIPHHDDDDDDHLHKKVAWYVLYAHRVLLGPNQIP